jgi:hypothetical protein
MPSLKKALWRPAPLRIIVKRMGRHDNLVFLFRPDEAV